MKKKGERERTAELLVCVCEKDCNNSRHKKGCFRAQEDTPMHAPTMLQHSALDPRCQGALWKRAMSGISAFS